MAESGALAQQGQPMMGVDPTTGKAYFFSANMSPFGEMSVQSTPENQFHDTFDVSLDTAILWNTPVNSGTGSVAANVSPGQMTLSAGTAASGYSYITSKKIFPLAEPGFLEYFEGVKLPASIPTNSYCCWGNFTPQTVPTAANPVLEGTVFEIQPGGKMFVASYAGGVRTPIVDMSAATGNGKQPIDGIAHSYYEFNRGDLLAWSLDGINAANFQNVQYNGVNGPNVNSQPIGFLCVNGLSPPSSALTLTVAAAWVAQTGFANWINDGTYGFIKATVKDASKPPVVTDTSLVTAQSPWNFTHIAAGQATSVIKASAGVLHSITFGGAAAATNVTTVYDNPSGAGTVISIPAATAVVAPDTVLYDVAFANGLTIITTTANGSDMTVAWK